MTIISSIPQFTSRSFSSLLFPHTVITLSLISFTFTLSPHFPPSRIHYLTFFFHHHKYHIASYHITNITNIATQHNTTHHITSSHHITPSHHITTASVSLSTPPLRHGVPPRRRGVGGRREGDGVDGVDEGNVNGCE